ncbi:MAG: iron-sulfur cluster assembly scaffold protein [Campylobacterales bacterium]|nr:iron-sulfur cluster assembly scaffold protein [Campylobacterales bacterium]
MQAEGLGGGNIHNNYSQKVMESINSPKHKGEITLQEALEMGARLIVAPNGVGAVRLYWAVDEATNTIKKAKFQCFGTPVMVACSDRAMELCLGKSIDEVLGIGVLEIEKALRDSSNTPALPLNKHEEIKPVIGAIYEAVALYKGVDASSLEIPPSQEDTTEQLPSFGAMSIVQKVKAVDKVIDEHIRAMLVMDGGNMEILDIKENGPHIDIYIRYLGACSGCASANTGTLFAIEATLKRELDNNIRVLPI